MLGQWLSPSLGNNMAASTLCRSHPHLGVSKFRRVPSVLTMPRLKPQSMQSATSAQMALLGLKNAKSTVEVAPIPQKSV